MEESIFQRFKSVSVDENQQKASDKVRKKFMDLVTYIDIYVPEGRERSICLTKLEEALFFANAGIARN